jgi:hypothetical protein
LSCLCIYLYICFCLCLDLTCSSCLVLSRLVFFLSTCVGHGQVGRLETGLPVALRPERVGVDEVRISRIYNWMKQYVDDGKIPFAQVRSWSWALVLVTGLDLCSWSLRLDPIGRGPWSLGLGLLRPLLLSFLGLSL